MPPTLANGKICYIEVPAADPQRSADFYSRVFGWTIRRRGDGALAFDDGAGEVSGVFRRDRTPSPAPGLLIYIMVDDIAAAIGRVTSHSGVITQPVGADAPELTARFRDPGGNILGLYQEPSPKQPFGKRSPA